MLYRMSAPSLLIIRMVGRARGNGPRADCSDMPNGLITQVGIDSVVFKESRPDFKLMSTISKVTEKSQMTQ